MNPGLSEILRRNRKNSHSDYNFSEKLVDFVLIIIIVYI